MVREVYFDENSFLLKAKKVRRRSQAAAIGGLVCQSPCGTGDPSPTSLPIMVIESRNSANSHYFDTKSLIWSQIFYENLSIPIAMNIGKIKFL